MAPQKKGSAAGAGGDAPGPAGELERLLAAHPRTEFIDPLVADLCGGFRAKRMPIDQAGKLFGQGIEMPYALHLIDATGDSCDPLGIGIGNGAPDGTAMPIAGTLAPIPWSERPGAQVLLTFFEPDRRRSRADPRWVLEGVLNRYRAARLHPVAAVEYEFYLIDRARDAAGRPQPPLRPGTNVRETGNQPYLVDDLDAYGQILGEIGEGCRVQGIGATTSISEFAPGQFEINLQHRDDILRVADEAALFRRVVKAVARRHGMEATFMPKPYGNQTGSGQHVHLSLLDDSGSNLFDDGSGAGSVLLRSAIAGLAATMREAMLIFAPSFTSFRRFAANAFVPVNMTWGYNNRSVAFRVPSGPGENRRIEHRVAGADANPYLVLAAVLAGVLHGIEGRLEPGAPSKGNVCTMVDPDLPLTVPTALQALRNAAVLPQWLGAEYLALYAAVKEGEYAKFMGDAFEREFAWYL
jgi:glutamine synthetase